jgi:hypothetical protein
MPRQPTPTDRPAFARPPSRPGDIGNLDVVIRVLLLWVGLAALETAVVAVYLRLTTHNAAIYASGTLVHAMWRAMIFWTLPVGMAAISISSNKYVRSRALRMLIVLALIAPIVWLTWHYATMSRFLFW